MPHISQVYILFMNLSRVKQNCLMNIKWHIHILMILKNNLLTNVH